MDMPRKWRGQKEARPKGTSFLAEAKANFHELFAAHVAVADDFASVEEFVEVLEKQSWQLTEDLVKKSWHNGVARGQGKAKRYVGMAKPR